MMVSGSKRAIFLFLEMRRNRRITNEGLFHPMEIARCFKTRYNSNKNRPHDHKTFELRVSHSCSIIVRSEWAYLLDTTFWLDVFQEWVTNHVLESFVTIEPGFTTSYSTLQRLSSSHCQNPTLDIMTLPSAYLNFTLVSIHLLSIRNKIKWVSDCCWMPNFQNDDEVNFVLDQHIQLDF
jgi:hypothetical protein